MKSPLKELIDPTPKQLDPNRHYDLQLYCRETRQRYKIDFEAPISVATNSEKLKIIVKMALEMLIKEGLK